MESQPQNPGFRINPENIHSLKHMINHIPEVHSLTITILIDYPIHIGTISLCCPFCILRGHRLNSYDVFLSLKIVFYLCKQ